MIDLKVFGREAIRPKSGTGCNMGDRLGSVLGWKLLGRNRAPDVTWGIDLEIFGM